MIESDWNMAASTLQRIDQGIRICNDGLYAGDFTKWLKGLYWFLGELSTWMNEEEQKLSNDLLGLCRGYKQIDFLTNLNNFSLATQNLRRVAHKNKLLLREAEDTSKHGG